MSQLIRNIKHMTRPTKHDEPMATISIRIPLYQKTFLYQVADVSAWIRNAIDKAILEEVEQINPKTASKEKIVTILQNLKKQEQLMLQDPIIAKGEEQLKGMKRFLAIYKSKPPEDAGEIKVAKNDKIMPDSTVYLNHQPYPCWAGTNEPINFIIKHNLVFNSPIPYRLHQELITELEKAYDYTQAIFEAKTQQLQKLQSKIEELQQAMRQK